MTKRTILQNKALHKYLERLSDALNDAGLDMRKVLKPGVEIPWNKDMAKKHLWKPIQEVMMQYESTSEAETPDYAKIYEVINRHTQEKFGISVRWPCKDDLPESLESYETYREAT